MSSYVFDGQEEWLEGATLAVLGYIKETLNSSPNMNYEILDGFPPDELFERRMPLNNVLVHWDIDNIDNPIFGFGDTVVIGENSYNSDQVTQVEAQQHVIHFDLGIWATERAGGGTARLRAYQRLTHALSGTQAYRDFQDKAGLQIQTFDGGQFIIETINDIKVWRVANMSLAVQVFNRRYQTPIEYIQEVNQDSGIKIDDMVIVDDEGGD